MRKDRKRSTKKDDNTATKLIIVLTALNIIEKLADIIIKIIDKLLGR